jgi:hypothetical protein
MPERAPDRETNPIVILLARLAIDVETREREAGDRRRTIKPVDGGKRKGAAA